MKSYSANDQQQIMATNRPEQVKLRKIVREYFVGDHDSIPDQTPLTDLSLLHSIEYVPIQKNVISAKHSALYNEGRFIKTKWRECIPN
jgi:hypothetical protein